MVRERQTVEATYLENTTLGETISRGNIFGVHNTRKEETTLDDVPFIKDNTTYLSMRIQGWHHRSFESLEKFRGCLRVIR
jgi:hypothetical protein